MTLGRIRRPARSAAFAVTLLALCLVAAGCGKNSKVAGAATPPPISTTTNDVASQPGPQTTPPTEPATQLTTDSAAGKGDYLGCHEFCMQAGGIGGGEGIKLPNAGNVDVSLDPVKLVDGMLPVTIRCTRDDACQGWILATAKSADRQIEIGRSDLSVGGNSNRVIAVRVSQDGLDKLNETGQLQIDIMIEYDDPACPALDDGRHPCFTGGSLTVSEE